MVDEIRIYSPAILQESMNKEIREAERNRLKCIKDYGY